MKRKGDVGARDELLRVDDDIIAEDEWRHTYEKRKEAWKRVGLGCALHGSLQNDPFPYGAL